MGGTLVEEQHGRPPVTRRKEPSIGEQHRDQERLLFAGGAERGRKPPRPVRGREIAAMGARRGAALRILLPARGEESLKLVLDRERGARQKPLLGAGPRPRAGAAERGPRPP